MLGYDTAHLDGGHRRLGAGLQQLAEGVVDAVVQCAARRKLVDVKPRAAHNHAQVDLALCFHGTARGIKSSTQDMSEHDGV